MHTSKWCAGCRTIGRKDEHGGGGRMDADLQATRRMQRRRCVRRQDPSTSPRLNSYLCCPYFFPIDLEITVAQDIAHADELPPRNARGGCAALLLALVLSLAELGLGVVGIEGCGAVEGARQVYPENPRLAPSPSDAPDEAEAEVFAATADVGVTEDDVPRTYPVVQGGG